MNVRWRAVLTGFAAHYLFSAIVFLLTNPEPTFALSPDLSKPGDLLRICLGLISSGLGGYLAGRMARTGRALNGLLVAVVGILFNQLGPPLPRVLVIASATTCLAAALGGILSRYPPLRQSRSSGQR